MNVRSLTLDEWFLGYQLNYIKRHHFHVPVNLDLDMTHWAKYLGQAGGKPRWTALLIKLIGIWASQVPDVNRALFNTLWGQKVIEFDQVIINVPLVVKYGDVEILSATTVKNPHTKSISAIHQEIKNALALPIQHRPISRLVIGRSNNWWNRSRLRILHTLVYRSPSFYKRLGGGGISVSSLLNHAEQGFDCRPIAFGHTAMTFCCSSLLETPDGRMMLKVGVGCDHLLGGGQTAMRALKKLNDLCKKPVDESLL